MRLSNREFNTVEGFDVLEESVLLGVRLLPRGLSYARISAAMASISPFILLSLLFFFVSREETLIGSMEGVVV